MKKNNFILFFSFLFSFNLFAEVYYAVSTENLNLRKSASTSSETITTINKGDTVKVYYVKEGWAYVKYNQKYGSVSNDFLTTIDFKEDVNIINSRSNFSVQKGFIAGFNFVFARVFFFVFVLFGSIITFRLRRTDARFKKGYREGNMNMRQIGKLAAYAAIISVVSGLIGGIVSLFH